jgi:zinc protease
MPKEFAYSRDFFSRFYTPDNVLIIIAGDVDPAAVHAKAKAEFSSWKGQRQTTRLDDEPALTSPRSLVVEWANPTQRRVHLGWRVPSAVDDPKQAALGLLLKAYLFSNSSELVKRLVLGGNGADAPAEQIDCWWDVHKDASLFPVAVRVKDGADVAAVINRVQAELDAVGSGRINDRRFNDVKSNLRYSLLMSFTSADRIAGTLAWMTGPSMNPGFTEALFAALADTSVVELQRYVATSFSAQQRATVELHHTPAASGAAK